MFRKIFYLVSFFLLFISCLKKSEFKRVSLKRDVSLFIEMPKNVTVFENLSWYLYEFLWNHFSCVGYDLRTNSDGVYRLSVKIKNLEKPKKFVSPDLLPYSYRVKVELLCQLFNKENKLLAEKTFNFGKWVSRSQDPILNSKFLLEQYKELFENNVPRIDQYFRKFLLQSS